MHYTGTVIEMGDVEGPWGPSGLIIEIRPQVFISIAGFTEEDMASMPDILHKNVKITIEVIDEQ